jgi:hypothetical protein
MPLCGSPPGLSLMVASGVKQSPDVLYLSDGCGHIAALEISVPSVAFGSVAAAGKWIRSVGFLQRRR